MGTLEAAYVESKRVDRDSLRDIGRDLNAVRAFFSTPYHEIVLEAYEHDDLEERLAAVSEKFNVDVFYVLYQSVVDAFQFIHWKDGKLLRKLVYGCEDEERTWNIVEGIEEEWEKAVLFHSDCLQQLLERDNENSEKEEIRRIYANRELTPGKPYPTFDARDAVSELAESIGLWKKNPSPDDVLNRPPIAPEETISKKRSDVLSDIVTKRRNGIQKISDFLNRRKQR